MHELSVFNHAFDGAFARRLKDWRKGGAELTDAEAQQYLEQADPDLIMVNNYIMEQLTEEEARAFEDRLVNDDHLFEKVWPIVALADALHAEGTTEGGADRVAIPIARAHRRRSIGWALAGFAAACLASVIIGGAELGALHVARAREAVINRQEGRADVGTAFIRTGTSTGPNESHSEPLAQGQFTLRPNSRSTISMFSSKTGNRTLDGSALLWLPRNVPRDTVNIRTATAFAAFKRGYFDITSVPGSGVTTVVVYEGLAEVRPLQPAAPFTPVTARHRAIIGRDGSVVVDSIGDTPAPPKDLLTRIRGGGQ